MQIKELEHSLTQETENCRELRMEMSALQQQIIILKRDHRSSIATQTRFHDANMSSIARLKDRSVTVRQAGRQTGTQAGISTDRRSGRRTDRKADRQTDRQTGIKIDRQVGRQATEVDKLIAVTPTCHPEPG